MLAEFIKIRGNPFQCQQGDEKLKNFMTQIEVEKEIAKAHCSFISDTQEEYAEFRKATYVDKSRLLSDKITKFSPKPVDYIDTQASDQETTKVVKKSEKLSRLAMKILIIAKDKADELEYVLQHDKTSYNYLFDGSTKTKTNKSQLISLLKACLIQKDYKFEQVSHNVSVFVDFMSYLRSQLMSNHPGATFGTVLTYILSALVKYSLLLLILLNAIYTRQHGRHDFISPECSKVLDTTSIPNFQWPTHVINNNHNTRLAATHYCPNPHVKIHTFNY